jgi:hypothetical protein
LKSTSPFPSDRCLRRTFQCRCGMMENVLLVTVYPHAWTWHMPLVAIQTVTGVLTKGRQDEISRDGHTNTHAFVRYVLYSAYNWKARYVFNLMHRTWHNRHYALCIELGTICHYAYVLRKDCITICYALHVLKIRNFTLSRVNV